MKHRCYTLLTLFFILSGLLIGQAQAALSRGGDGGARRPSGQLAASLAPDAQPAASYSVRYTYDAAGRLLAADYGNGQRVMYAYDNAGNLLRRTVSMASQELYLPLVLR